jgi:glycosyltransferase involved in cell wall biosynthesis
MKRYTKPVARLFTFPLSKPLSQQSAHEIMRVLVLSSVFPNSRDQLFGVFVKERIVQVARHCQVIVVAPVPWFPFGSLIRGTHRHAVPRLESIDNLQVYHPRFFSVPGLFKSLDGVFYFISVLPLLLGLHREFPFDLIDAHFVYPDGVAACLLAKWFGCPVTITLRGTIGKLAKFFLRRKQIQWALASASRVFSVSRSLQEIAVQLACDPQKTRVVPNGIDCNVFQPLDRVQARNRLGIPLDRIVLLSVGALCERKGHHRIMQVLPRLISVHPNLLFVAVGGPGAEGDMGPSLARLSHELGLDQYVRLVGARPHHEIAVWLAAADLFCLATSNEGMANVLVEALACGVPVVTTRVGGNAELVQDGVNGLLVSHGDTEALQGAVLEALHRKWLRESVARTVTGRTWDATAAQITQEWRALIGMNSRAVESPYLSGSA